MYYYSTDHENEKIRRNKNKAKDINISLMMVTILSAETEFIKTKIVAKIKNQDLKKVEKKHPAASGIIYCINDSMQTFVTLYLLLLRNKHKF